MVPDDNIRAQLERTLSTMPIAEGGFVRNKPEMLGVLVPLLKAFSASSLEAKEAKKMVSELLNLSSQEEAIDERASIAASAR